MVEDEVVEVMMMEIELMIYVEKAVGTLITGGRGKVVGMRTVMKVMVLIEI